MVLKLRERPEEIQVAAVFARAVYGDKQIDGGYNRSGGLLPDYGRADDYEGFLNSGKGDAKYAPMKEGFWDVLPGALSNLRGAQNGQLLFKDGDFARELTISEQLVAGTAEALVAVGTVGEAKTLVYAVRGTGDEDTTYATAGQSYVATGNRGQYKLHQEWLDAAIAYAEANGVEKMIVTGHSMGGGVVEQFAVRDAHKVDSAIELTMVGFGSAGLAPGRLEEVRREAGGNSDRLNDYIGISHSQDPVTFPERWGNEELLSVRNPLYFEGAEAFGIPEFIRTWKYPVIRPLLDNWHPDDRITDVNLPYVDGTPGVAGFGVEHFKNRYVETTVAIATDPMLLYIYDKPPIVMGRDDDKNGDRLNASNGRDYLIGLRGNDNLFSNGGDDVASGGFGHDSVFGGDGNDTLSGGRGDDYLSGGNGTDTASYIGGPGSVMGAGNGSEYERVRADLHRGTARTDLYNANGSLIDSWSDQLVTIENIDATRNDDRLVGDGGANFLRSYQGDDTVDGAGGNDLLEAWAGDDVMQGGIGSDTIRSGEGDDLLRGDAPSDFDGAPTLMALNVGRYTSQYAAIGDYDGALTEDAFTLEMLLRPGSGPREAAEHFPTFVSYHSAAKGDEFVIRASPLDEGRPFLQVILNGTLIETDIRADSMFDGGLYRLSVGYDGTDGTVRIVMDDQKFEDTVLGIAPLTKGGSLFFGQEQDSVGGGFNDFETYRGDLGDIRIWSGLRSVKEMKEDAYRFVDAGAEGLSANWRDQEGRTIVDVTGGTALDFTKYRVNDNLPLTYVLRQDIDADLLEAGEGDDTLEGGIGGDTLDGGTGTDTATYVNARFGVTVDLEGTHTQTGEAADDRFVSIENLTGSRFDDLLSGDGAANRLKGAGGNDTLEGGAGADTLDGGSGADRLIGGRGNDSYRIDSMRDRIVDEGGTDSVTVEGSFRFDVGRSGIESVRGAADAGRLFAVGGRDAVEMTGANGDDILVSSGAADILTGAAGADTFAFLLTETADGATIADFDRDDVLAFDDRLFGMGGSKVNLRPLDSRDVIDLLDTGRVAFDARSKELSIDVDGSDGPDGFQVFARFDDISALGPNDVMIF